MASLPHIVSKINGMKIPLLPGQAGIMHRFRNPENQLVIASVTEHGRIDSDERMVLGATPEPQTSAPVPAAAPVSEVATAPARKPRATKSAAEAEPTLATGVSEGLTL